MATKEMSGHGVFVYNAVATVNRYGSPQDVVNAVKDLDMQHVWVRIHGSSDMYDVELTQTLIEALRNADIGVAGWGWCQGANVSKEARLALNALNKFGLTHYVADIEQGVNNSNWTADEITKFFTKLREGLPSNAKFALSSHGFIFWHEPSLIQAAHPLVDFFAPQVYWFWHPGKKMLKALGVLVDDYPLDDPSSYARLCSYAWRQVTSKPLIITGQAYWGEVPDYTQSLAEDKVKTFIGGFSDWSSIQGLNWWHLGGKSQNAMSYSMYTLLREAKLNQHF
jgi:hypothetical protein